MKYLKKFENVVRPSLGEDLYERISPAELSLLSLYSSRQVSTVDEIPKLKNIFPGCRISKDTSKRRISLFAIGHAWDSLEFYEVHNSNKKSTNGFNAVYTQLHQLNPVWMIIPLSDEYFVVLRPIGIENYKIVCHDFYIVDGYDGLRNIQNDILCL